LRKLGGDEVGKSVPEPDLSTRLRRAIKASELSLNQLGKQAGVEHSRLSRFLRGERDLTLDAAARLFEALGFKVEEDKGIIYVDEVSAVENRAAKAGPARTKPAASKRKKRK
jgi:transcriptional regulator with XRE-family HTH domain